MGRTTALFCVLLLAAGTAAWAAIPFHFGFYPAGPLDGITDVPGVLVSHVTKVDGTSIRTGATAILPNADPWSHKVSAAAIAFNGNGQMTGTQWVNEAGFLETPIVLTDTLDVLGQHHTQLTSPPLPIEMEFAYESAPARPSRSG